MAEPILLEILRRRHDMTQAELGKRVGKLQPDISNYETQTQVPSAEVLQRLANVFDIDDPGKLLRPCTEVSQCAEESSV